MALLRFRFRSKKTKKNKKIQKKKQETQTTPENQPEPIDSVQQAKAIERRKTLVMLDHLESIIMRRGWPIPFTPYYFVNHQRMLLAMDDLRQSILEDDMDERFFQVFGNDNPSYMNYLSSAVGFNQSTPQNNSQNNDVQTNPTKGNDSNE